MTNEEALEKITNLAVTYSQIDADTCELLTIAKKAIEKQIPKKVIYHSQGNVPYCPNCNKDVIGSGYYCWNCGQHITYKLER